MIHDPFENAADSAIAPAERCFAIVPADSGELPMATKVLYVGTGGDVTVRPVRGDADVVFRNVPGGMILDIRVVAVRAGGTTAADIVGLA